MNAVRIHLPNGGLWHRAGPTYVRGYAFLGHHPVSRDKLYRLLSSQESLDAFMLILKQLNGFFAVIHTIGETVLVAVDRTRSFPLYYGSKEDALYVSDDPYWVRERVKDKDVDDLSASEFLLTGYVTGNNTLYPHVKQVQAGEVLVIRPADSNLHVQTICYYRYAHGNHLEKSPEDFYVLMDEILLRVFKRLIWLAAGRTLVVPLSGGYDSRLIVLMLKRLGYPNIVTYSYGRRRNAESQISKEVAKALNIRWEFVPYTNEAWSTWYHTGEYARYRQMAHGLVSVPHIQDWPAIWELTKHRIVPEDGILVPGAMPLGAMYRFPILSSRERTIGEDQLIRLIYNKDYELQDASKQTEEIRRGIYARIKTALDGGSSWTLDEAADVYERWWWQQRASKFLINSVRAYEYWGYEWWLPLWDSEFVDFWSSVPLAHRRRKSLYKSYARKLEKEIAGLNIKEYRAPFAMPPIVFTARMLSRTPFIWPIRRMVMLREYGRHPLAWWGIMRKEVQRALCTGRGNINSYLALDTLRDISQSSRASLVK